MVILLNATSAFSLFAAENDSNIVDLYGQLKVEGNQIINEKGKAIALRGMSLFWSQWIGKYYNYDCIK